MKREDTGVSVSLHSLSFPGGLSVDAWWPSLSHISTYGLGLRLILIFTLQMASASEDLSGADARLYLRSSDKFLLECS